MMFVTLVCVILGVISIAPGLGVPLAFIAFVAWLRTVVRVQLQLKKQPELTTAGKVLMFFQSVAVTMVVLFLVVLAGAAALFIICIVNLSSGPGHW